MLAGFQLSQALYVAARLGVPDALAAGPRPIAALAAELGVDRASLARLVRTLTAVGVFRSEGPGRYGLGPLGPTLTTGTPGSVRDLAIMWLETHYGAFGRLLDGVRQGRPAADLHYGEPFFSWLGRHPDHVARFTGAMADLTASLKAPALARFDLGDARLVVDVGGADGAVLAQLLADAPAVKGIVYDLPHVVGAADDLLARHDLADRVRGEGGDFFTGVPAGGDLYVLAFVLHDWSDAECVRILANVRRAMAPGGRLALIEFVVPDGDEPHPAKMIDLTMLGMLTGQERTRDQWATVLGLAGFELTGIATAEGEVSIIDAR
jgi:hypothetical protein